MASTVFVPDALEKRPATIESPSSPEVARLEGGNEVTNELDALSLFPRETSLTVELEAESHPVQPTRFAAIRIPVTWQRREASPHGATGEAIGRSEEERAPTRVQANAVPFNTLDAQPVILAHASDEVTRIANMVLALEARISKLTESDESPLAVGEARAAQLEHRGAEITAQLEQSAKVAEGQTKDIGARLAQTDHIGEHVSLLEARIGKLTEPDQPLGVAEGRARQLEHRSGEITGYLEHVTAQLEQTATAAEAQKKDLAARLVQTDHIGEQVSVLEARISKLTEQNQPLAVGATIIRQLEQRGSEIAAQVQQCLTVVEALGKDMTARLAQAGHLGERVSTLEARIGKLIDRGHALEQADGMVERLEHRFAETTAELKRARKAEDELRREVARLQQQITSLRDSARKQVENVAARKTDAARKPWLTMGVVAGVMAAALAGMTAARSVQVSPQQRNGRAKVSAVAASVPVLPSRPLSLATSRLPTLPAASRTWRNTNSSDASSVSTRIKQAPPRARQAASLPRTAPSSNLSVVKDKSQSPVFIGALDVRSDPAGSAVFFDRKYVGETPIQLTELRAGSHTVWIERDGYQRWTASVLVAADKRTQVAARLQPAR